MNRRPLNTGLLLLCLLLALLLFRNIARLSSSRRHRGTTIPVTAANRPRSRPADRNSFALQAGDCTARVYIYAHKPPARGALVVLGGDTSLCAALARAGVFTAQLHATGLSAQSAPGLMRRVMQLLQAHTPNGLDRIDRLADNIGACLLGALAARPAAGGNYLLLRNGSWTPGDLCLQRLAAQSRPLTIFLSAADKRAQAGLHLYLEHRGLAARVLLLPAGLGKRGLAAAIAGEMQKSVDF